MATLPAHLVATPVLDRLTGGSREAAEGPAREPERVEAGPAGALDGTVLGVADTAVWIDLGGFVVVITTREVPLLPNAIALAAGSGALAPAAAGSRGTARFGQGRVAVGALQITWDPAAPPTWDPTVPVPTEATPATVAARGAAVLRALGSGPTPWAQGSQGGVDRTDPRLPGSATLPVRGPADPDGGGLTGARGPADPEGGGLTAARPPQRPGVADAAGLVRELARVGLVTAADPEGAAGLTLLLRAVRERDPEPAVAAVRDLLGRGPGLTPEGDDLLAAVAGALASLGPVRRLPVPSPTTPPEAPAERTPPPEPVPTALVAGPTLDAILAALAPIPGRTTPLSATLLALALERRLPEPAGRLLDLGPAGETAWPAALGRLERLGHGSGRAYAAGIAATAILLATPERGAAPGG